MDDRRLADLARRQGGLVASAQLQACGLTSSGIRHRVLAGRLFRVRHGVYALSPHPDPRAALWAAVLAVDVERAAVSYWSALAVHRMTSGRSPSQVHVTLRGARGRSAPGLRVHGTRSSLDDETLLIDGLHVTSPARTVIDVAARAGDDVVARLIREGEFLGLLSVGEMARTVAAHARHPGAARVARVDPATAEAALEQTPIEDELDALLRTLPLPAPERQFSVRGVSGAEYRFDFAWPAMRLAAEADGRSAHERASAMHADRFRDNDLSAVGWLTMRFTRLQIVRGAADSRLQIINTAASRGWRRAA